MGSTQILEFSQKQWSDSNSCWLTHVLLGMLALFGSLGVVGFYILVYLFIVQINERQVKADKWNFLNKSLTKPPLAW